MSALYRYRDSFAAGPALLLLAALQMLVVLPTQGPSPAARDPIEIFQMALPVEERTPPPPPQPQSPTPKALAPRPATPSRPLANPSVGPEVAQTPATEPAGETASPARHAPKAMAEAPPSDPLPSHSPPAPQPSQANPVADLEAAYVSRVRQMLNAIKRYPTGREASLLRPSGSVRVWLLLERSGRLLDRGIETSSQSILLDNAALKTVSGGHYPPFPTELWAGQAQRRFYVDIDFVVPNN